MIIARFNCPACETPIEAPADSVARGVRCPQCDTGFFPEKTETLVESPEGAAASDGKIRARSREDIRKDAERERDRLTEQKARDARNEKWGEYHALKDQAANFMMVCFVCGLVAILAIIAGAVDGGVGYYLVSGGLFSAASVTFIVAQLIHLRAGLEKLSIKE